MKAVRTAYRLSFAMATLCGALAVTMGARGEVPPGGGSAMLDPVGVSIQEGGERRNGCDRIEYEPRQGMPGFKFGCHLPQVIG